MDKLSIDFIKGMATIIVTAFVSIFIIVKLINSKPDAKTSKEIHSIKFFWLHTVENDEVKESTARVTVYAIDGTQCEFKSDQPRFFAPGEIMVCDWR